MWEITLSGQILATLWSVPVGAALCLLYDTLRVLRRKFRTGLMVAMVSDILFFVLAAFVIFCIFLIFCAGQIRFYVFLGALIGFLLCRFTISRIFTKVFAWLITLLCRLFARIGRLLRFITRILRKFFGKIAYFAKNIAKKVLQPIRGLMYNLKVKKLFRRIPHRLMNR